MLNVVHAMAFLFREDDLLYAGIHVLKEMHVPIVMTE